MRHCGSSLLQSAHSSLPARVPGYFFSDACVTNIWRLRPDGLVTNFISSIGAIDIEVEPDGALYWIDRSSAYRASYTIQFRFIHQMPDKRIRLVGTGHAGEAYVLQASTNLLHWAPVATNSFSDGAIEFYEAPPNSRQRFYRLAEGLD